MGLFTNLLDPDLGARLESIEYKLDAIIASLGIELPESAAGGSDAKLRALIASGNKIGAIKIYRKRTGSSLRFAKAHMDRLEREGQA